MVLLSPNFCGAMGMEGGGGGKVGGKGGGRGGGGGGGGGEDIRRRRRTRRREARGATGITARHRKNGRWRRSVRRQKPFSMEWKAKIIRSKF